jgi:hypothetical protein
VVLNLQFLELATNAIPTNAYTSSIVVRCGLCKLKHTLLGCALYAGMATEPPAWTGVGSAPSAGTGPEPPTSTSVGCAPSAGCEKAAAVRLRGDTRGFDTNPRPRRWRRTAWEDLPS